MARLHIHPLGLGLIFFGLLSWIIALGGLAVRALGMMELLLLIVCLHQGPQQRYMDCYTITHFHDECPTQASTKFCNDNR
jgi:hypothetical protein